MISIIYDGINILLVGYVVFRNTAFWPALLASLITLTSVDLIRLHATAYSEPLYFFLGLRNHLGIEGVSYCLIPPWLIKHMFDQNKPLLPALINPNCKISRQFSGCVRPNKTFHHF